jgi:hypothetical protein
MRWGMAAHHATLLFFSSSNLADAEPSAGWLAVRWIRSRRK